MPANSRHLFQRHIIRVTQGLAEWAVNNNKERLLACYLILKRKYQSGHFHIRTLQNERIAKNPKTLRQYINALVQYGFAERIGEGYRLLSMYKVTIKLTGQQKKLRLWDFTNQGNISAVVKQVRLLLFKNRIRQQQWKIQKEYKSHPSTARSIKYCNGELNFKPEISIGYNSIGKIFSKSKTTAFRFIKEFKKAGELKKKVGQRKLILRNTFYEQFLFLVENNKQNCKLVYDFIQHSIFACFPNTYTLTMP